MKQNYNVSFGTSGHRGIIGDTFTHNHIQAIALGVASYLLKKSPSPTCVIGTDPRQGNDPKLADNSFTKTLVQALNTAGINTISYTDYIPTPLISWTITHYSLDGGLILTASHNPPNYNGIKFNTSNGAPAEKAVTEQIQHSANKAFQTKVQPYKTPGTHQIKPAPFEDFSKAILKNIQKMGISIPKTFNKTLSIDTKHGACAETWKTLAKQLGISINIIHATPKQDFGNIEPNPTQYTQLPHPNKTDYFLAANDPDGDRHAVITTEKNPLTPEELTSIISQYLCSINKAPHAIATTLASSHIIKALCKKESITYHETAVGFKYFAEILTDYAKKNKTCLAVESSGGFSSSHHTLEKCGFFPIIALICILENTQTPLETLKTSCLNTYGHRHFTETALSFNKEKNKIITQTLETASKAQMQAHFEQEIEIVTQSDGLKITLKSDDWVLCRLSGTEPVARLYAESSSKQTAQALLKAMSQVINA